MPANKLYVTLSVILDLPLDKIYEEGFFKRECGLTRVILDNEPDRSGSPPYTDYKTVDFTGVIPDVRTHCFCGCKIRWNYVCCHIPTQTAFILGSSCVELLNADAFGRVCLQKDCHELTQQKFCNLHKRKCVSCDAYHDDNHICKCPGCGRKEKLQKNVYRCSKCTFGHYAKH